MLQAVSGVQTVVASAQDIKDARTLWAWLCKSLAAFFGG